MSLRALLIHKGTKLSAYRQLAQHRLRALLIHKGTKPCSDMLITSCRLRALLIHKGTKLKMVNIYVKKV